MFGIFYKRAVDNIILVILQNPNPFMSQHLGNQGNRSMALTVGGSPSQTFSKYPFLLVAERKEKVHFLLSVCIILKC